MLLDAVFSVVYIAVMLLYSVPLTFAALGVLPLFVGLTMGVAPIIRRQLRQQAEANARVQRRSKRRSCQAALLHVVEKTLSRQPHLLGVAVGRGRSIGTPRAVQPCSRPSSQGAEGRGGAERRAR